MVRFAILKKVSLTAWEVLSHRALNSTLNEQEKQERSDREKSKSKHGGLKNDLNAAEKKIARLEEMCGGREQSRNRP